MKKLNDPLLEKAKKYFSPREITQIEKLREKGARLFKKKYGRNKLPISFRLTNGHIIVESVES